MASMAKKMGGKGGMMDRMQQMQGAAKQNPQLARRMAQMMGGGPGGAGAGTGAGGMPDMSQLANMFGGGAGGGMPDMGEMMKKMSQNPGMMKNLMNQFGLSQ
jgi:hypothetical protein